MNPLDLVFLDEARAEFDDAADWYDRQKPGLGDAFVNNVQDVFDRITVMPRVHPVVYKDVRRAVVKKFPYIIHYQVEPDRIVVISVFHTSRNSEAWKSRIP
jgi:plasmid stabilization system protein ParE